MTEGRTVVGISLPSILVEWWLLLVFVPDGPDFPHDRLILQVLDIALPAFIAAILVLSCWRLLRAPSGEASRASVISLFAVACFLLLLPLGPLVAGRLEWQMALNTALGTYLVALGAREFARVRRVSGERDLPDGTT